MTIILDVPPRYTSGEIHLGHILGYSLIDFYYKYLKMIGKSAIYPLCFDSNGLPVELIVEKVYGKNFQEMKLSKILEKCSQFTEEKINKIKDLYSTMNFEMQNSFFYRTDSFDYRFFTQKDFLKLYSEDKIYVNYFPVNWCHSCRTSLSESELEFKEIMVDFFKIDFSLENFEKISVLTRFPELITCAKLILVSKRIDSQYAINPINLEKIPIFLDEEISHDFGFGNVMICTYGNKKDIYYLRKYGFKLSESLFEESGKIRDKKNLICPSEFRKKFFDNFSFSKKTKVSFCWRCDTETIIITSKQFFIRSLDEKNSLLEKLKSIEFFPNKFFLELQNWINSLRWDWVISRNRYWGTPIPMFECYICNSFFPIFSKSYIDPRGKKYFCPKKHTCKGTDLIFDTWMDSSITYKYLSQKISDDSKVFRFQSRDILRSWLYYSLLKSVLHKDNLFKRIIFNAYLMVKKGIGMHTSKGNALFVSHLLKEYSPDSLRYFAATAKLGDYKFVDFGILKYGERIQIKIQNFYNFLQIPKIFSEKKEKIEEEKNFFKNEFILNFLLKKSFLNYSNHNFANPIESLIKFFYKNLCQNLEIFKKINSKKLFLSLKRQYIFFLKGIHPIFSILSKKLLTDLKEDITFPTLKKYSHSLELFIMKNLKKKELFYQGNIPKFLRNLFSCKTIGQMDNDNFFYYEESSFKLFFLRNSL